MEKYYRFTRRIPPLEGKLAAAVPMAGLLLAPFTAIAKTKKQLLLPQKCN